MVSPCLISYSCCRAPDTLIHNLVSAGKDILSNESYKKRIILESGFNLPSLEAYSDTVKFFGFNQFFVYPDAPHMTAAEGKEADKKKKENILAYMSKIGPCDQPFLAIWVYHVPTKQLLIEHNFLPFMTKEQIGKASFALRMMMKPNVFRSCACEQMPVGKSHVFIVSCLVLLVTEEPFSYFRPEDEGRLQDSL